MGLLTAEFFNVWYKKFYVTIRKYNSRYKVFQRIWAKIHIIHRKIWCSLSALLSDSVLRNSYCINSFVFTELQ